MDLYCLISPPNGCHIILPSTVSRYWPSYDQWITGSLEPFWQEVPSEKKLEENQQHQGPWQYQPQTVHDHKRNTSKITSSMWIKFDTPQKMGNSITKIYHIHLHCFHPQKKGHIQRNPCWMGPNNFKVFNVNVNQPTSKMLSSCFKRSFSLSTLRLNACSSANKRRKDASPQGAPSWRAAI